MKWQPTFITPQFRSQDWMLPSMILGAVFIHGLAFYLIQASAPLPDGRINSSARLSVLDPQNPRDLVALRWIENHDPAAIAYQSESPEPPQLFNPQPYQPSYEKVLPTPLPILKEEDQLLHKTFFPPGPVPEIKSIAKQDAKKWTAPVTKIIPSPSLDLKISTTFSPPQITGDLPTPARFLVVNLGQFDEKTLFLLESSGNDILDDYARNWLTNTTISFKNNQSSGSVQIYWGSEIWKKTTP